MSRLKRRPRSEILYDSIIVITNVLYLAIMFDKQYLKKLFFWSLAWCEIRIMRLKSQERPKSKLWHILIDLIHKLCMKLVKNISELILTA